MNSTKILTFYLAKIIAAMLILIKSTPSFSQVYGCKDVSANNYNAAATINDGSCTYNATSYTPPIKTDPINAILSECSGLQMAGNFLWAFNDGGGAAALYKIDTLSSTLLQTVNLGGATNKDWEDISFDGTYFYVGDFGNNANGARTDLKIYKFPFSAIPAAPATVTIPANQIEVINFTYSDQPQPPVATTERNTKFDCEAMIIDNGQIHLFTKNWIDVNTTHYVINSLAAGSYVAAPVDTLASNYLVTAADKAPGQDVVVLLGYQSAGLSNCYMHILSDYSSGKYFNGNKRRLDLPNTLVMGQAEGITFRNNTYGYISNENFLVSQRLRSFNISNFIPLYVLPLTLKNFTVTNLNGSHKIAWAFYDKAENVQVEYSSDGAHFSVLKTYNSSVNDTYYNKPANPVNYYRLSWHTGSGAIQHSNIISLKDGQQRAINNFLLKANGELSFTINGTSGNYAFKLLSSDGKTLSQTKEQLYAPGLNRIYVSKKFIPDNLVCLMVYSNKQETTALLQVAK